MTKLLAAPKKEARKKGAIALVAWAGTGTAAALGWWYVLAGGALASVWLTWRWLRFRGKWGLRL